MTIMTREELLKRNPYWVETVDGAFTLAIHIKSDERIDSEDWDNNGRKQLTEIAREQLSHFLGYEVKKLD